MSAYLEVQGDACFQSGLYRSSGAKQIGWFLAGTALLVCYSLFLNSSKIDFGTVDLYRLLCTEVKLLVAGLGFLVSPRPVPFFSLPLQFSWGRRVCQLSLLRHATTDDSGQICDIYNHYILKTPITFEEQPVPPEDMVQRIEETLQSLPWLVWEEEQQLLGYAYASKWKGRCAYRHSVESTIYLHPDSVGKRIGSQLYGALLTGLRQRQFHTVIGGIALPNETSVALHEKFGFEKVAHFTQVGKKFDHWIDVGYWQLLLLNG